MPGGTYVAVPDGGTVHVRPDESRGVMIGGLPFQLDTEVKLVGESDPTGLSFVRDEALAPEGMPPYGPRYLKAGDKIEGARILTLRDHLRQLILHTDMGDGSRSGFRSALERGLSDHFYIDFDGTVHQALDVALCAYHAGDGNQRSVSVSLNNPMPNLMREPNATPHPRILPEGASPTPPPGAASPGERCKLVEGTVVCEILGRGYGTGGPGVYVVGRDALYASTDGTAWETHPLPPFPLTGLHVFAYELLAVGDEGRLAILGSDGQWRRFELGVKGTWRDGWAGAVGDSGTIVVLVGDGGVIARSSDFESFSLVESGVKRDLVAIAEVGKGRLVASFGDGAMESRDLGLTWRPLTDSLDLAAWVPRSGVGRCLGRIPGESEVCNFAQAFESLNFVDAFVQVGEVGVAYTRDGYRVTENGGLSWESAVTRERADELARYPRPMSERMSVNGAKVQSYGYTEPQYQTLGALVRLLANVFPALGAVAPKGPDGEVVTRVLDDPEDERGVLAHWHWDAQRWDPGPGFDWARLERELEGRPE